MKKNYTNILIKKIISSHNSLLQFFDSAIINSLMRKKLSLVKCSAVFLSINFANSVSAQAVIYSTDFGTVANVNPAGWSFTGVNMNISTNNASSGYTGASGNAYLGEGNSAAFVNTSATSEPSSQIGNSSATFSLSTIGYPSISVAFGMRKSSAGYNTNATYTFEWSSNGVTYNTIAYNEATAGSWGLSSGAGLTLPAAAGNQATLYLRWSFFRTGTASNFKIDDLSVTGNTVSASSPPTILMNVASTTNFLDGGVSSSPSSPYILSGVISDPTDPARTLGVDFTIGDPVLPASSLTVNAVSSNNTVVPTSNILLTGSGASRNVKITPVGVGYSNITLSVNNGTTIASYILSYAASAASSTPSNTIWQTGMSDGSDAIALDDNYYMNADDELDIINVYSRSASGLPLVSFDYSSYLALPDPSKPEVDVEAATTSPVNASKKYWLGSMSTGGSAFTVKPNRDRLFSTLVSGTGAATTFSFVGYYGNLRAQLVAWGDANGYNFTASAAAGVDSKNIYGYAAEGMVFGPDNTTLYVGLRAPLVPTANRVNAVIAPIVNFESWFNNGSPSGNPTIGPPIELNLGVRGIRDMMRLTNGTYIIVAGNPAGSPITSAIYKWTGNALDAPILVTTSANGILNMEGAMQINVSSQPSMTQLQVISDGGADVLYADATAAKDFADLNLRKFRVDNLNGIDLCLLTASSTPVISQNNLLLSSTPGASYQWFLNAVAISGATSQTYTATQNGSYYVTVTNSGGCAASSNSISINDVGIHSYSENNNSLLAYPNPYTESTSLQLTLASSSNVIIEVYSILGQKIHTITNSNYPAGIVTFNFGAKKLGYSSGVYIVKTIVNDKTSVIRIIENN